MSWKLGSLLFGGIALCAIATFLAISGRVISACQPVSGSDVIKIDISGLAPGDARTFCYKDAAARVRFVLARGQDGKIRSVLDACRECYVYRQGYKISGHSLICRICGNRYPVDHMQKGKSSCVPVPLAHEDSGANVKIKVADLKQSAQFF